MRAKAPARPKAAHSAAVARVLRDPAVQVAPTEVRRWLRSLLERGERASSSDDQVEPLSAADPPPVGEGQP
jgi:hypothetical protein